MSEWRPGEGWVNLYSIAYESHKDTQPSLAVQFGMQGLAYEDGADAMLTALRKQDIREFSTLVGWVDGNPSGTLVYIPDEE